MPNSLFWASNTARSGLDLLPGCRWDTSSPPGLSLDGMPSCTACTVTAARRGPVIQTAGGGVMQASHMCTRFHHLLISGRSLATSVKFQIQPIDDVRGVGCAA